MLTTKGYTRLSQSAMADPGVSSTPATERDQATGTSFLHTDANAEHMQPSQDMELTQPPEEPPPGASIAELLAAGNATGRQKGTAAGGAGLLEADSEGAGMAMASLQAAVAAGCGIVLHAAPKLLSLLHA